MFSAGADSPSPSFFAPTQTTQPRANGVLGAAFSLLGDVLSSQQQQQRATRGSPRRGSKHSYIEEDMAYGDDENVEMEDDGSNRPRGFISKFAERLINNSQRSRKAPRSREQSPVRRAPRRSRTDGRTRSYRTEERQPHWAGGRTARVEDTTDEDDIEYEEDEYEDSDKSHERLPRRASTADQAALISALSNEAEHHRSEMRSCKKRLEQASRRPNVNTAVLQGLINELKEHETAYITALSNLENAKAGGGGSASQRRAPHHSRPSRQRHFATTEHAFTGSSLPSFEAFFGTRRSSHPLFDEFDHIDTFTSFGGPQFGEFERIFNDDFFFAMPRAAFASGSTPRSSFSAANSGPQFRQTPGPTFFSNSTPKPPPNILKPEEAKKLFKMYNERWNALTPADMNIPFPCRGMQPGALSTRDTIWAPLVSSPVSSWSEETVMQANAQAFFLGVVGLTPQYTEAPGTGRIVMGYDKARANPEQIRELVDILKKEKTRWHSDRLGRRNGGITMGPNEELQRDERTRAIFHAVCELMEVAQ